MRLVNSKNPIARLDQKYVWHPFTQMRDWLRREPIVIVRGRGAVLRDNRGREYLDANSSIWTNLHGHAHPGINAALGRQLRKIAHSSALGLANEPASLLAQKLVLSARLPRLARPAGRSLEKVFFSDDGSTAMEAALKLAYEFARRAGANRRPKFVSLGGAYHGDTVGAVALGHIDLFHKRYSGLLFKSDQVMAPYCYRCPFNRARPERSDARSYRRCGWECLDAVERAFAARKKLGGRYAGFVFEPLMQGAAGMIPQPEGWLRRAGEIARSHGALLVADEVMTGFGRAGMTLRAASSRGMSRQRGTHGGALPEREEPARGVEPGGCSTSAALFACQLEGVQPDILCVAKGLTGGYLPMAATLTTRRVFDAFLGGHEEFKTFFHGHSYTANQLGAAASLASLELLQGAESKRRRAALENRLRSELRLLWTLPAVGDIRQVGLIAGVELVRDWRSREKFDPRERAGVRVCEAMARRGVLTRPVGDVIVLMPPYCTTAAQLRKIVRVLFDSIREIIGASRS